MFKAVVGNSENSVTDLVFNQVSPRRFQEKHPLSNIHTGILYWLRMGHGIIDGALLMSLSTKLATSKMIVHHSSLTSDMGSY